MRDLHAISRRTRNAALRNFIVRCTAPQSQFETITSRADLLALARQTGVRVPESMALPDMRALQRWMESHP
ncbi:MAG TPA: hypothetical protein VHO91_22445, partial [Rhodopila sp.]|nr:hypothetical protein [Rhodopila sp.]